jgi:hypothetical protein
MSKLRLASSHRVRAIDAQLVVAGALRCEVCSEVVPLDSATLEAVIAWADTHAPKHRKQGFAVLPRGSKPGGAS